MNRFLINRPFLITNRNLTSFCRLGRDCLCHKHLSFIRARKKYLECQPHTNGIAFVFNFIVSAIRGKTSPEVHIQMLSSNNVSYMDFSKEKFENILTDDLVSNIHLWNDPKTPWYKGLTPTSAVITKIFTVGKTYQISGIKMYWKWIAFFLVQWMELHFKTPVILKRLKTFLNKGLLECIACHLLLEDKNRSP